MKHPDGTPMTPEEWMGEQLWRRMRLSQQQRSCHPASQQWLPLFERYAEGELGNLAELLEAMEQRCVHGAQGVGGPEIFEDLLHPAVTGAAFE